MHASPCACHAGTAGPPCSVPGAARSRKVRHGARNRRRASSARTASPCLVAVLEHEPAAGSQPRRRAGRRPPARASKPVGPANSARVRLVAAHLPARDRRVVLGNVRRIADDQRRSARPATASYQSLRREPVRSRVRAAARWPRQARWPQRRRRCRAPGTPGRSCAIASGDRATAGRRGRGRRPLDPAGSVRKRAFHDELGLGARHQHVGRHRERQRPELLLTQDVGDRLAARAPRDVRLVAIGCVAVEDPFLGTREQRGAAAPERRREQQLGFAPRLVRDAARAVRRPRRSARGSRVATGSSVERGELLGLPFLLQRHDQVARARRP